VRAGPLALTAVVALAVLGAGAGNAGAVTPRIWSRPARAAGPEQQPIVGPQLEFSAAGGAAIAFAVQNEQLPAQSRAFTAVGKPPGRWRSQAVRGAQVVLGAAFSRSRRLWLLTGTAPSPRACCATVSIGGSSGSAQALVTGLTGTTDGRLVALPGGELMAAIATQRGLWVAQSDRRGTFAPGSVSQLQFDDAPADLDATALPSGCGAIAWSVAGPSGESEAHRILYAVGSPGSAPAHPHVAVSVGSGNSVDQLAIASSKRGATVAWVQSSFSALGAFRSVVMAHDLRGSAVVQVSASGVLASDLAFAGDGAGDQVLAWDACSATGTCSVQASARPAGGRFGPAERLGAGDPIEAPTAAISAHGDVLVGWIRRGDVLTSARGLRARRFGPARTVAAAGDDNGVSVGFAPNGAALAVWMQGTVGPSLMTAWAASP
jgi:hypothetical protein